jgi:hypothetical protein
VDTLPTAKLNVFIVEDDAVTRDSLRSRIEAHPRLQVGAASGTAADTAIYAELPSPLLAVRPKTINGYHRPIEISRQMQRGGLIVFVLAYVSPLREPLARDGRITR